MTDELTTYELADGIAIITLDDGKVNALSPEMLVSIGSRLDRAEADEAVVSAQRRPSSQPRQRPVCGIENRLTGSRVEDVPDLTDVAGDHQPDAIRV